MTAPAPGRSSFWRGIWSAQRRIQEAPSSIPADEAAGMGLDGCVHADEFDRRYAASGHVWRSLFGALRSHLVAFAVSGVLLVLSTASVPVLMQRTIAAIDGHGSSTRRLTVALSAALVGNAAVRVVNTLLGYRFVSVISRLVQVVVHRRLQRTDPVWLRSTGYGVSSYVTSIPVMLSQLAFVPDLVINMCVVLALLAVLLYAVGPLGLVAAAAVVAITVGLQSLYKVQVKVGMRYFRSSARRTALIEGWMRSWGSVRRQRLEPSVLAEMDDIRAVQRSDLLAFTPVAAAVSVLTLSSVQIAAFVLVAGMLWLSDLATPATLLAMIVALRALVGAVNRTLLYYACATQARASTKEVEKLYAAPLLWHDADVCDPETVDRFTFDGDAGDSTITVPRGARVFIAFVEPATSRDVAAELARQAHGDAIVVGKGPVALDGSIAHNVVLWAADPDEARYEAALLDSGLWHDLTLEPSGDATVLSGTRSRLSDGQLVRLATARALYARPNLLIIDDVLSTLDPSTADRVVSRVLAPGATEATVFVRSDHPGIIDHVDQVLVCEPGRTRLVDLTTRAHAEHDPVVAALRATSPRSDGPPPAPGPHAARQVVFGPASRTLEPAIFDVPEPSPPTWRNVFRSALRIFPWWARLVLATSVACVVAAPLGFLSEIDRLDAGSGRPLLGWLLLLIGAGVGLQVACRLGPLRRVRALHARFLDELIKAPDAAAREHVGPTLAEDFPLLEDAVGSWFGGLLSSVVQIVGTLLFIMVTGPLTTLVVVPTALVTWRIFLQARIVRGSVARLTAATRPPVFNFASVELASSGFRYHRRTNELLAARFARLGGVVVSVRMRTEQADGRLMVLGEALAVAMTLAALWTVVLLPSAVLISGTLLFVIVHSVANEAVGLSDQLQTVDEHAAILSRLAQLAGETVLPAVRPATRGRAGSVDVVPAQTPVRCASDPVLAADHIVLPFGSDASISFTVDVGAHIVLTGRTGVGKSTIVNVLSGALAPARGRVTLLGLTPDCLAAATRGGSVVVASDLPDAPLSVRNLLDPDAQYDAGDLATEMNAYLQGLGLDRVDPGVNILDLSPGQRQALNLYRARMSSGTGQVLLVDEATSSLGVPTERAVLQDILRDGRFAAVLAVMHRTTNQDLFTRRLHLTETELESDPTATP
jgi:ABC-type bacteriocin/lantibiotic exporter with double-glycine peptidase domain